MTTVDEWLAALESGRYEKGRHRLRHEDRYCCLGVLADLDGCEWQQPPDDGGKWTARIGGRTYRGHYDGSGELATFLNSKRQDHKSSVMDHLIGVNDKSDTFDPIITEVRRLHAIWIERQAVIPRNIENLSDDSLYVASALVAVWAKTASTDESRRMLDEVSETLFEEGCKRLLNDLKELES